MRDCLVAAALAIAGCLPARPDVSTVVVVREVERVDVANVHAWNGEDVRVAREPSGEIVATAPDAPRAVLVARDGTMRLDVPAYVVTPESWVRVGLDDEPPSFRRTYASGTGRNLHVHGDITMTTPRDNLLVVREQRDPPRWGAPLFLGLGVVAYGGAAAATYGAATADKPGETVGAIVAAVLLAALGTYGTVEGLYRIFGTSEERVLYVRPR